MAVHHGSLPRPFLHELENLLKRRALSICICSPTLAQGLDLCFSVLIFRSLYRRQNLIPPTEFANVIGRVGRAYVDLDGIYLLPVYERDARRIHRRINEFWHLNARAQQRQLESGVRQLIEHIVKILRERLGCTESELMEYVLNSSSSWDIAPTDDADRVPGALQHALNELDVAILSIAEYLETETADLSDYLDTCLASSYWRRRLSHQPLEFRTLQETIVRGRAKWIWEHTDATHRRGCYAGGVGFVAGRQLSFYSLEIYGLLNSTQAALDAGECEVAIPSIIELAAILFQIAPFRPWHDLDDWRTVLAHWFRGTALATFAKNEAIAFIQDDVVYRLVWGIEAARLNLKHTVAPENDIPGGNLPLLLTYGVPNSIAALLMQAGLASRTVAIRAASFAPFTLTDYDDVRDWLRGIAVGYLDDLSWEVRSEEEIWRHFVGRFGRARQAQWTTSEIVVPVTWKVDPLPAGTTIRIAKTSKPKRVLVLSATLEHLGTTELPDDFRVYHAFGRVRGDCQSLEIAAFGPHG